MFVKSHWWKILCVLILLYVLIAGLSIPLKPGIVGVSPVSVTSGTTTEIEVIGYNSHFLDANKKSAWLRLDENHLIAAKNINPRSDNTLDITFDIPAALPENVTEPYATLILDNDVDGTSILPGTIYVKKNTDNGNSLASWTSDEIVLYETDLPFLFPFRNILNETIRNTFFHIAIWFAMFFVLILSLIQSIKYLISKNHVCDIRAAAYAEVGIIFGLIGIATGSIWAKFTWGAFWTSDVKLNMSAIAILIYVAYGILRGSITDRDSKARVSAAYNIFAFFAMIPLIFIIPRMTDSLHPGNGGNPALGGEDLDNTLRMIFYPAIIGWSILAYWMSSLKIRLKTAYEKFINQNKKS
jgi:heme exporter protein C